jgi:hypothetical protein
MSQYSRIKSRLTARAADTRADNTLAFNSATNCWYSAVLTC